MSSAFLKLINTSTLLHSKQSTTFIKRCFSITPIRTRLGTTNSKIPFGKTVGRRRTLKEVIMAPAGTGAFTAGKGLVIGASVLGLGAVCFYLPGFSKEAGWIDRAAFWPEYVKKRIKTTYLYFGAGLGITAVAALAAARSPAIVNLVTRNSMLGMIGSMAAIIGSGMVVRSMPYTPDFGLKQLAWMGHVSILGAFVCPLVFLGGQVLIRAAWMTAGICGGLSAVAVTAPSEKFLQMGGMLGMGLGVVLVSSIGSIFLPVTTVLGAGLHSIVMYGGLVLFGGFLLYDTQKIMHHAEALPPPTPYVNNGRDNFDPINASISIYLDVLNIFMRLAWMMAGGGNRRK